MSSELSTERRRRSREKVDSPGIALAAIRSLPAFVTPAYIVSCLLLGGASGGGVIANAALQLAGIAIIFWLAVDSNVGPVVPAGRPLLWIGYGIVAVILLQLVPLPPGLWSLLPGRQEIVYGFDLIGTNPLPWEPLSVDPERTIDAALDLIPPAAVLLAMLKLRARGVRHIVPAIAITAMISIFVGIIQRVQGEESALYFYEITNFGSMTGFFSNSNHLATLLLVALPFVAALFSRVNRRPREGSAGRILIFGGMTLLALVGLVANGSFAGFGLALPAFAASLLLFLRGGASLQGRGRGFAVLGAGITVAACALLAWATLAPMGAADPDSGSYLRRPAIFANTARAALSNLPTGTGLGTFQSVYPAFEDPSQVRDAFINHAHNDYLEVFLELGITGIVLLGAFAWWWLRQTIRAWRGSGEQILLARAGTIASAVIILHSFVDYPLRTTAIATLFAFAIGLMVDRPRTERMGQANPTRKARHVVID